jgi:ORF6N domain-containing protein
MPSLGQLSSPLEIMIFEVANCDLKMKPQKLAKLLNMPKRRGAPVSAVESRILFLRRQRIILDTDLAELYRVPVKRLNEQVRRNHERFPSDFMFQLHSKEQKLLRSQIATSNNGRGGRRYLPYAFTEHGAIMAATVLSSERAIHMSVRVVRAFVRLRELLSTNRRLAAKVHELENHLDTHDSVILDLIKAIRELTAPRAPRRRRIGFELSPARKA